MRVVIICAMDVNKRAAKLELAPGSANPPTFVAATRCLQSNDLFRSDKEIIIEHAGAHYRLRITQHGKLILTK